MMTAIQLKASLLSHGLQLTNAAKDNYGLPYLEKRRAYGNADPSVLRALSIPQEILLGDGPERLVASANFNNHSPWRLDYDDNQFFLQQIASTDRYLISFPERPVFYGYRLSNGEPVTRIITLYGGQSLGIFAYGKCHLVQIGEPCHYCSIAANRDKGTDFLNVIHKDVVYDAVRTALNDPTLPAKQIMLNGGNFEDMDKSFLHYVRLTRAICLAVKDSGKEMDIHLIVYPPKTLSLMEELAGLNVSIAINTEIYDPELFAKYCPGKVSTAGRSHILAALQKGVEVLGKGRVFSIFVGGLEPLDSLKKGMHELAQQGITPIINVLHTDPETPLQNFPNPSVLEILEMGKALQEVFGMYNLRPFYENCGRNSIDSEAYQQLFF